MHTRVYDPLLTVQVLHSLWSALMAQLWLLTFTEYWSPGFVLITLHGLTHGTLRPFLGRQYCSYHFDSGGTEVQEAGEWRVTWGQTPGVKCLVLTPPATSAPDEVSCPISLEMFAAEFSKCLQIQRNVQYKQKHHLLSICLGSPSYKGLLNWQEILIPLLRQQLGPALEQARVIPNHCDSENISLKTKGKASTPHRSEILFFLARFFFFFFPLYFHPWW